MAIAHVCLQCGWDLARTRPQREPHYGLMLLRCPRCRTPAVRRVHPVKSRWRQLLRFHWQTNVLGFQVAGLALFTGATVMTAIGMLLLLAEWQRLGHAPHGAGLMLAWTFAILAPLVGAWLTAAFSHLGRWRLWPGWLAWIALVLVLMSIHGPLPREIDPRHAIRGLSSDPPLLPWFAQGVQSVVLPAMLMVMLMMICALAGLPLGMGMLRLAAALRQAKRRRLRRRRRLSAAAAT